MGRKFWAIDLKCTEKLCPSFVVQTAGYQLLHVLNSGLAGVRSPVDGL